jgi:Ca-activated chloride channel family protein
MTPERSIDPDVLLIPLKPAAPAAGGAIDVLVQVKAPPWDPLREESYGGTRPRLRLALVLDRSAGMAGKPLADALRCVQHIVSHLRPDDQVALVLFDRQVGMAMPLREADKVEAVNAALVGVEVEVEVGRSDQSALSEAWRTGVRQLAQVPSDGTSRVLLFTSGNADLTATGQVALAEESARWRARGVSTTTVCLGAQGTGSQMMTLAKCGGGQHYAGYRAAQLCDGFDQELGLYRLAYLSALNLKLIAAPGVTVEALGQAQLTDSRYCDLPDLAFGAVASLLLRLQVPPDVEATRPLLTVRLRGNTLDHMTTVTQSWPLILDNLGANELDALPSNEAAAESLLQHEYGETVSRARALIRSGKAAEALEELGLVEASVAGHPWLQEALAHLKDVERHTSAATVQDPVASELPLPIAASVQPNESGTQK